MMLPGTKGLPLRVFFRRLGAALSRSAAADQAAQLAYFYLLSLFPLLSFLVSLTAFLPLRPAFHIVLRRLGPVLPASMLDLVQGQLWSLLTEPRPKILTVSLLFALYAASRGIDGFRKSLNRAYGVTERRSIVRTQWLALWTTVVLSTLVLVSFALLVLGGRAIFWVARHTSLAPEAAFVWHWARWPTTALIIMLVTALAYYLLPDVEQRFKFITPGSITSTVLWLLATWGFTQYADNVTSFDVTYGSLGAAVVLLTWLYITAFVLILGGEINALIEQASPEGKKPGSRELGLRTKAPP